MTEDPPDDLETRAALYALGLMGSDERVSFARCLERDAAARELVAELECALLRIGQDVTVERPPASLRDRLIQRVRQETARPAEARIELSAGVLLVLGDRLAWEDTRVPGVRVKPLHVDTARRYASSLVSMAKGAVYPRHRHAALEELFMVSGEASISGHRMKSGDYCRADTGTLHDEVIAETDCLFLALASQDNPYLPGPTSN
jgi:anti-sigma factor ChrR (cupin superfamily)